DGARGRHGRQAVERSAGAETHRVRLAREGLAARCGGAVDASHHDISDTHQGLQVEFGDEAAADHADPQRIDLFAVSHGRSRAWGRGSFSAAKLAPDSISPRERLSTRG